MKARVVVTLKTGVLDPQGKAIEGALRSLSIPGVYGRAPGQGVRYRMAGDDRDGAYKTLSEACERLLANTIVENYAIEVDVSPRQPPSSSSPARIANRTRPARSEKFGCAPAIVWHADPDLPQGADLVVLPGGFSYGDYLRCGAIAARSPIMRAVARHAERGGLVLGICNGFQILCEAGLLPGVLMRNANRRFLCKMQHVKVENAKTPFTRGYSEGQVAKFAIAHGEGNFEADDATLEAIEGAGRSPSATATRRAASTRPPIRTDRSMTSPACSTAGSTSLA